MISLISSSIGFTHDYTTSPSISTTAPLYSHETTWISHLSISVSFTPKIRWILPNDPYADPNVWFFPSGSQHRTASGSNSVLQYKLHESSAMDARSNGISSFSSLILTLLFYYLYNSIEFIKGISSLIICSKL